MKLSVIICAYNPVAHIFQQVLDSLKAQSLDQTLWELIIIDNNSKTPIEQSHHLDWHSDARIIVEEKQGLIHCRIRGTIEAKYEYIITVDDDTPLFEDYLENALNIYLKHPELGIIGGRSYPIFESTPPAYVNQFKSFLAIRDLGEDEIFDQIGKDKQLLSYPVCSPILIAPKKSCMLEYKDFFENNEFSKELGRKGKSLASGEDNDINLYIYKRGYTIGYFPQLKFYHIIPSSRLTLQYFQKMAFESNKSWVKVLQSHHINPWKPIPKWTYTLRKIKSYLTNKAWQSPENSIRYYSSIGILKGLSEID